MNDVFSKLAETADGCWVWTLGLKDGYGRAKVAGRHVYIHRWVWEFFNGPVPEGLSLDHLCQRKPCANPAHLDPVPHRVNVLRGDGPTARNARKDACHKGHQLEVVGNRRQCRTCLNVSHRTSRSRLSAKRTGEHLCPICGWQFDTQRGVRVHTGRRHPIDEAV